MSYIKQLRLDIDKAANSVQFLKQSREVSFTYTNLQRSFMWLGEALKAAGSASPYVNSENPANAIIEPQAEKSNDSFGEEWATEEFNTQTARVKDFRSILEELIGAFRTQRASENSPAPEYDECLRQSFAALKEAKMWLGWELARIRGIKEGATIAPNTTTYLPL